MSKNSRLIGFADNIMQSSKHFQNRAATTTTTTHRQHMPPLVDRQIPVLGDAFHQVPMGLEVGDHSGQELGLLVGVLAPADALETRHEGCEGHGGRGRAGGGGGGA
jgi:hypothetical protein